jgi:hypothetical protein
MRSPRSVTLEAGFHTEAANAFLFLTNLAAIVFALGR